MADNYSERSKKLQDPVDTLATQGTLWITQAGLWSWTVHIIIQIIPYLYWQHLLNEHM